MRWLPNVAAVFEIKRSVAATVGQLSWAEREFWYVMSDRFACRVTEGDQLLILLVRLLRYAMKPVHRRATGAAMRMLRPLNRLASVTFDDGSRLIFPIGDVYWNAFLWQKDFDYEPEVRHLLQALYTTDYLFIDAGANIGYWSVLVTSAMLGRKRAVAIEASPETFAFLKLNSAANDHRFGVRQNAIFATDGIKLGFTRGPHATRHIAYDLGRGVDTMTSVTLDTIAGDVSSQQKVVVKLDVEGSEVEALAGCRQLLQRDTLIIFEDHGNDSTHATTRFVMENALPVYWLTDHGRILAISRPGDLDKLKINRYRGYNLVTSPPGCSFQGWLQEKTGQEWIA